MNILLIEDDEHKSNSIIDFILLVLPLADVHLAKSLVEATECIYNKSYELILIDMAIPSHPTVSGGGAPMSLLAGGLEIILELRSLERTEACVIITQNNEVELSGRFVPIQNAAIEIKKELDFNVISCIEYVEDSNDWKIELERVLK